MYNKEDFEKIAQTNLSNKNQVKANALLLENLILKSAAKIGNDTKRHLYDPGLLSKLQLLYETFETNLEIDFAQDIIQGKKTIKDYLLTKRFITLIRNEVKLGKMTKNDKVLFIGCGPFPISAILFNQFVGCHIDCYEKRKYRANLANKVLAKLDLSDTIKVIHKKGETISDDKYNTVVIALLAKPKDKILDRIYRMVKPHTRIVCRTSDSENKVFYEDTNEKLLKKYHTEYKVPATGDQTISSILLVK